MSNTKKAATTQVKIADMFEFQRKRKQAQGKFNKSIFNFSLFQSKIIVCGRSTDTTNAAGESRSDSESERVTLTTSMTTTSNSISITISYNSDCVNLPSFSGNEVSRVLITTSATATMVCASDAETSGNKYQSINANPNRRSACLGLGLCISHLI